MAFIEVLSLGIIFEIRKALSMRDIRSDLRERHATVMGSLADEQADFQAAIETLEKQHRDKLEMLERERRALEALLAIEERREGMPALDRAQAQPVLPLAEFLTTKVHAHGPMEKEDLRSEADVAGYFSDAVNGRSFHTTLMNLVKHGKIHQLADGRYAYQQRVELFQDTRNGSAMTQ